MVFSWIWCWLRVWVHLFNIYIALWTCWDFTLPQSHGCQRKTWDSQIRDKGLYYSQKSCVSCLHQFPLTSKYRGGDMKVSPGGCSIHTGFAADLRDPRLRKSQSFKGAANKLLKLCPRGGHYLCYIGQQTNLSLSQRETIPVFQDCCTNILEQIVWNKSCWCLRSQDVKYKYNTHGKLPPNNFAIKMYI